MSNSSISTIELNLILQSANPPVIVDVRKKPAFDQDLDTLPGATWQIHEEVAIWARDLPSDLRVLGFDAVFLKGGIDAWKQASLPLAKSSE